LYSSGSNGIPHGNEKCVHAIHEMFIRDFVLEAGSHGGDVELSTKIEILIFSNFTRDCCGQNGDKF